MKGDFTRRTFDRKKHHSSVRMQQGRVQIDADWNELVEILQGLMRQQTIDVMGPHGVPTATPDAFRLEAGLNADSNLSSLRIHRGRIYVDGILCELDEDTDFTNQPDFPGATLDGSLPTLVYLEVRERLITALEDPSIAEVALGGPDTAVRTRPLCQVKLLPITTPTVPAVFDFDALFPFPASPAVALDGNDTPRGNQLYRVEVHSPGAFSSGVSPPVLTNDIPPLINSDGSPPPVLNSDGNPVEGRRDLTGNGGINPDIPGEQPTFKWSRDNGSVVAEWTDVIAEADGTLKVEVNGLRRATFAVDDFVELTDDSHELRREPGVLRRVLGVEDLPGLQRLTLDSSGGELAARLADFKDDNTARKKKARRWESGELPIGKDVSLPGGGVKVSFASGKYTTGDAWIVPVRQGSLESLTMAPAEDPPHYAELAVLLRNNGVTVEDRRTSVSPIPAIQASLVPRGVIVMWSGSETSVPAGWALCDGNNGTPNLRGRFIMGADAGNPVGLAGGPDPHNHGFRIPGPISVNVDGGGHVHDFIRGWQISKCFAITDDTGGNFVVDPRNKNSPLQTRVEPGDGSHTHTATIGTIGGSTDGQTGGIRPAYFALAFIMKL